MSHPLRGTTIALAEGRQLEELAAMLEGEGATILRCPLLSILDAPQAEPVEAWLRRLIADEFALVVLMTGEAIRRLVGFADRAGLRDPFVEGLGRVRTLTRGPKPVVALKEIGLKPSLVASAPTTEGVIASLGGEAISGKRVGVTLYGSDNPKLAAYLQSVGATMDAVLPYVFAPAADDDRVADLIAQLAAGKVGVVVFTSSPQVDRLWEVASSRGLEPTLLEGLRRTCVAAVGPLVADRLREKGTTVQVCPEQGWVMKNLVRQIVRSLADAGG